MSEFRIDANSASFWIQVKPRSTRERLTRGTTGELKLEIHAPATEGQANEACIRFLARALRVPQSSIVIASGQKSRRKLIRVNASPAEEIASRIAALAPSGKRND
jgi:uncharacterized protein (TIGR00251 family)